MTPATDPAVPRDDLEERLADIMLRHEWPNTADTLVPFAQQDRSVRRHWLGKSRALLAGPLAPLLSELATLRTDLAAREAEIAGLRAERDAAVAVSEMNATSGGFYARHAENAAADRDAWKARAEAAEWALRPFAEAADDLDESTPDRAHLWESPAAMGLTAGDLRAARQALAARPVHQSTES